VCRVEYIVRNCRYCRFANRPSFSSSSSSSVAMSDYLPFEFVLTLFKPLPAAWRALSAEEKANSQTTPLQRAGLHRLMDSKVVCIVRSYLMPNFGFVSPEVKVRYSVAFANGKNNARLRNPHSLCELSDGCIAVAEGFIRGQIRVFRGGALVQTFNTDGVVCEPNGICTDAKDQILVTDSSMDMVHVFTRDGSHVRSFGSDDSADVELSGPSGVCVDSRGNILVADTFNHRICEFDSEGKFVRKFGSRGEGAGELGGPIGVCVDGFGNLFVAEESNNRVSKFSASGDFVRTFGDRGSQTSLFQNPSHVCVTRDGKYIIVADELDARVQVLSTADGSVVFSYKTNADKRAIVHGNVSCALTSDGRIYVSNFMDDSVGVLEVV